MPANSPVVIIYFIAGSPCGNPKVSIFRIIRIENFVKSSEETVFVLSVNALAPERNRE